MEKNEEKNHLNPMDDMLIDLNISPQKPKENIKRKSNKTK